MKSSSEFFRPLSLLQLALGLFFGLTGLMYLLSYRSSGAHFRGVFGSNNLFNLLTVLIELAVGIIFLIGLFAQIPSRFMFITGIIILIIWVIYIVISYFINSFLEPGFLSWLQKLSLELIVLGCIWAVTSQYISQ
ncbi:MAG: hypothetical protein JXB50_11560 [Spirochaetes bacterium]|nr:hypothetical protein [Spirochaetota bacterium]